MKKILLTGMSGTGKTTLTAALVSMSYAAVDLDTAEYSIWVDAALDTAYPDNEVKPGKDWVWNEQRVNELLAKNDNDALFVSGTASNMEKFLDQFDHVILLTAPDEVIVQRLLTRTGTAYGQSKEEIARVLRLKHEIEPLLREGADLEINTDMPVEAAVALILHHIKH